MLGNLLELPGFEYTSSDQIADEVRKQLEAAPAVRADKPSARTLQSKLALARRGRRRIARRADLRVDALVRRSSALQATSEARGAREARLMSGVPEFVSQLLAFLPEWMQVVSSATAWSRWSLFITVILCDGVPHAGERA